MIENPKSISSGEKAPFDELETTNIESPICDDFLPSSFAMTATTLYGLEETLANELKELGATKVTSGKRAVTFEGDKALLYRANYRLRCALRVLVPILSFKASTPDELYNKTLNFDWHKVMPIGSSFFIDTAVNSSLFTNSRYALYRLKDAIRDYDKASVYPFNLTAGENRQATICLHLHIREREVTISLDSSGESLHHRGYRKGYNAAPLNEVLAAGLLRLAGYDGSISFFDPMCGSGTLPIEAAMIASGTPAGYYRRDFSFKHWLNFDSQLWEKVRSETKRKAILKPILARDRDFKVIGIATDNIINASFRRAITIEQADFLASPPPVGPLLIITNPPYGKRITHEDITSLYQGMGEVLKKSYTGSTIWIIASPANLFHHIGLAHDKKYKLFNGDLECDYRKFVLFEGKKKDFVAQKKNPINKEFLPQEAKHPTTFAHKKREFKPEAKRRNHNMDKTPRDGIKKFNQNRESKQPKRHFVPRGIQVFGEEHSDK